MSKLEEFREVLRKFVEQLDILWVEKEACAKLAMQKGATYPEVELAKQAAVDDPEIRRQTRELFADMWKSLDEFGTTVVFEEMLQDLPPHGRPN
jgi:hypothetical protein